MTGTGTEAAFDPAAVRYGADELVPAIVQDVNDPLSIIKQREIRKPLRSHEDAKQ